MEDVQRVLQELQDTLFEARMAARTLSQEHDTEAVLRDLQAQCQQVKQRIHDLLSTVTQSYARISRVCDALSDVTGT